MTFLELCQRTAREGGIEGGLSSVTAQIGMNLKIVQWVTDAWADLQIQRSWLFMRATGTFTLTAAQTDYAIFSQLGLVNVKSWCSPTFHATDTLGRYTITLLEYGDFQSRLQGQDVQVNRPAYCALAPGYRMVFDAAPTINATVVNDYWKTSQTLVNDTDEPNMNEDWHMAIVYKALRDYAEHEESKEMVVRARRKFMGVFGEMCEVELPAFTMPVTPLSWGQRAA